MAQFRTDLKILDNSHNRTRYEVFMLSDRLTASGTTTDAFGRIRTGAPFTLFDSQHRYQDNGKWNTANTVSGANTTHNANSSTVSLNIDTTSGSYVYRETNKVFAYQPGKSLLIMNTFAMNTPKDNLRQRVGYFNTQNGVFLENSANTNYLVLRSYSSGAVVETRVPQSQWNVDKFDGTGYSAQGSVGSEHTGGLDVTKTNIFWTDIEWLGVGDVRCGFIVDGRMVPAHIFHNDNKNSSTYMTTACLPVRYEIENTGVTSSNSSMIQICSTVISEGGYELRGRPRVAAVPITTPKDMPTAGTFVPIISIRLKSTRLDSIVLPKSLNFLGIGNSTRIHFKMVMGATLTGSPVWNSAGSDSPVEYELAATGYTGGVDIYSAYVGVTNQATQAIELTDDFFRNQLERNSFTGTATILSLVATGAANGDDALASIEWSEIV